MGHSLRCYSSRPSRFGNKKRTQVLEQEPEAARGGDWVSQSQVKEAPPTAAGAPATFPSYEQRQQQAGSQYESLSDGVVAHMRRVYATLATGIGISAAASVTAMATPLGLVHPLIPGLGAMVPLLGLMYTSKHTHSQTLRAGLFAAFTGLSGWAMAPLLLVALKVSPAIVPQALAITTGLFGTMTALSLFAKPGSMLRLGVPLGAGMLMLLGCGVAGMFVPVTSAWYPLLHSINLYGGLGIFTLYIAYDTQNMINEYEMGEDDHLKHAVDLFINFKAIFQRVLLLLMGRSDD